MVVRGPITVSLEGTGPLVSHLKRATSPENRRKMLYIAGKSMALHTVPMRFRTADGGKWSRPMMRRGQPLRDTGRLQKSVGFRVGSDFVEIGTTLKYGRLQHFGGRIVPVRRKWLAIPLSPPLRESERQALRPRDFPGAFVLMHGPEGPGIYRKAQGAVVASSIYSHGASKWSRKGKAKGVERIFAFVKQTHVPARPFLYWDGPAVGRILTEWKRQGLPL